MAEKGFGVKEVNLIGASGTPTITSPNNLNLNANNVAISTNVSIGGTLSVTGNVSVGGTLTYEDVTNIDSVGLITAREGIKIPDNKYAYFGSDNDLEITHTGSNGNINNKTGDLVIRTLGSGDDIFIDAVDDVNIRVQSTDNAITCIGDGAVTLHYNGNSKLATTNTGVDVTGAITVNGSAISIDPTATDVQVAYELLNTSSTSNGYRISGNGVSSLTNNPDLYLIRGQKYRFINNSGGSHPFQIRTAGGADGVAYSTGVTNNGASSGNIDFAPTYDSPAQLVYQCTSHSSMLGNIYLRDAAGNNTNVGVTTFIGHVQANNIKLDRGSAIDEALIIDTTANTGASRITFKESGTAKGEVAYSHGNDQVELIGKTGNGAAILVDLNQTALKINSNGYVTKPLNPVFHVFGGPTNVNTNTDIVFGQQRFAVGGGYNTSTGEYTVPVTGYYHFYAQVYRQTTSSDSWWGFYLDTGSGYTQISESRLETDYGGDSARGYCTLQSSIYYLMTAGHKIKCRVGAAGAIHCNNTLSYFCGNLVG